MKLPKQKLILRILNIFLAVCIVFATGVVCINAHVKNVASKYITNSPSGEFDCIFVLGCGVRSDGSPSHMLADRLDAAIELYKSGVAPKIIMSGDHGKKEYDEVNVMRTYAADHGVAEEDIFMDHAGFSTYESIYRAKEIFCVKNMIIVTQEYHLYRALYISEKLGINSAGVSADSREYYGQTLRDIREIAARCKDFFTCIIKPEPTYLGETIPVSGDGRVTVD